MAKRKPRPRPINNTGLPEAPKRKDTWNDKIVLKAVSQARQDIATWKTAERSAQAVDNPRFFWLAGQGGYGILSSPALGALAASLLTGGEAPEGFARIGLAPTAFSPLRL